jgi:hypothetical protein
MYISLLTKAIKIKRNSGEGKYSENAFLVKKDISYQRFVIPLYCSNWHPPEVKYSLKFKSCGTFQFGVKVGIPPPKDIIILCSSDFAATSLTTS